MVRAEPVIRRVLAKRFSVRRSRSIPRRVARRGGRPVRRFAEAAGSASAGPQRRSTSGPCDGDIHDRLAARGTARCRATTTSGNALNVIFATSASFAAAAAFARPQFGGNDAKHSSTSIPPTRTESAIELPMNLVRIRGIQGFGGRIRNRAAARCDAVAWQPNYRPGPTTGKVHSLATALFQKLGARPRTVVMTRKSALGGGVEEGRSAYHRSYSSHVQASTGD